MSVKTAYGNILTSVMGQTMDLKFGQNWNVILKGIPLNPQSMCKFIFIGFLISNIKWVVPD